MGNCKKQKERKDARKQGRQFSCLNCHKRSNTRQEMINHCQKNHTESQKYFCKICGNGFCKKREVQRHEIDCDGVLYLIDNSIVAVGVEALNMWNANKNKDVISVDSEDEAAESAEDEEEDANN